MGNEAEKVTLKAKLLHDKEELAESYLNSTDEVSKVYIKKMYDLVNSYILICEKRNKF